MAEVRKAFPGEQNYNLTDANRQIESLIGVINNNADCLIALTGTVTAPAAGPGGGGVAPPPALPPAITDDDLCDIEMRAWLWRFRP